MMLRSTLAALAAAAACCMGPALAAREPAPYHVGQAVRAFRPDAPRHWRGAQTHALRTTIWYPAGLDAPEVPHDIGEPGRRTFQGHPLADGAPISAARPAYPLLLLSHGTGGTADSLDWLAAALAAQGYIVAGVDHPGNTMLAPLTREGFRLWWERATDLSQVLDGLLADPLLGPRIDADRIGAVGFSLGGYTVLELAGARTNLPAFERFCASPDADAICHPPEMRRAQNDARAADAPSPKTAASLARAGASYRDTRIKAVFAIAPALGMAFDDTAFAEVRIPVALIAGTADVTAPVDTNIRRIGRLLPRASVELIPGAAHYTFLDTCLPPLVERLAPVCKEAPGVDRDTVHAQAIARALAFFTASLTASQAP
ncbi:alpha/beta hydrolase family protein [Ralstonia solanacearum]|uniref:alpha/beta hydrolase family protein n=1 Tax=Ralstonia solanacearum TaxID=305 RepID=UPI0007C8DAC3|nr:peptidase [Ralstonia solanacearum]ATJ88966.1 peptidase [Ralstonia solanacearum]OAI61184.1 peptidase [Ralstonia solanacearum]